MKMTHDLLDNTVPHYTQLQQHSTEEENRLTMPRHMSENIAVTPEDHKEKKRKIDAKYRLGCKTRKEELGINLQNLREENAQLKREKESCWKEDNSMAQKLQSKELEIGHLKREIGDSKKVISDQTNLLETLSQDPFVQQLMGSFQAPETSCPNNRRRKSPEGFDFLKSDKKRMADKAYRAKCKEEREITKAENNLLKTEINRLKEESDRKDHALKSQEEENKHLQQKVRQLEGNLGKQNVVVEALTTQLGRSQNIDLQRENTLLISRLDHLTSCANNKDDSVILQLQERNEQLQRDKSTLDKIVEALCLKINNDKNQDEEHTP